LEESLAQSQQQQQQEIQARLAVPGLVNPNERPDDMSDL